MKPCRWSFDHQPVFWMTIVMLTLALAGACGAAPASSTAAPRVPSNFNLLPGPQAVQAMPVDLIDPSPDNVRLRFHNPPLEFQNVELGGSSWQSIRLPGESSINLPGEPDLPAVSRLVMISPTGNVELEVETPSSELKNGMTVAPTQILAGDDDYPAGGFVAPKTSVYGTDGWYPAEVARISDPVTLRDVRFVVVTAYPVQVNPVTGQVRVHNEIEVRVSNTGGTGPNEILVTPTSISPDFKRLYQTFENFPGSSLDELPVLPGKYLAICNNNTQVTTLVQRLVAWKKRRGLDASYVTTTTTGSSASQMRSYIRTQYIASGGALECVCLVGDPDGTGAYQLATESGGQYDNYFGMLNTNEGPNPDPVPDIAVGRLSCDDSPQLEGTINKTIAYESNPYTTNNGWFNNGWCVAHIWGSPEYVLSNPSTKQYTRQIMLQQGMDTVWWDVYNDHINQTTMQNRLTAGISVFNDRMSWISQITNSDVDNYTPFTPMQPFVMNVTCGTGNFDGDGTSEHWLRPGGQTLTNWKGAIGAVGMHGSGTHVQYNNIVDAGVMYGLYGLDIQSQGMAVVAGKLELYRNYHSSSPGNVQNFCYWTNLMGDPAVPIWRRRPVPVNVARPATLDFGANNVTLTVTNSETSQPVPDALVCLMKDDTIRSRGYTNAAGQINLPFTTSSTGYLYATITKENIKPKLDSINIVSSAASLGLNTCTVDDDNLSGTSGDNNHVLNPGEMIDLIINLANRGSVNTVTGISGTLTTTARGITIVRNHSPYPNIAPGANANPDTAFRIQVSSVLNGVPCALFLNLASSVGAQTVRVDLTPVAGDVAYHSFTFYGPGGNVNPGEEGDLSVTFHNNGSRQLVSAQGILRSYDSYVSVIDSIGTYGNVAIGATTTNSSDYFHISVSPGAYNGHRAVMQLTVTDANGFRDSTEFDSTNFFATDTTMFVRDTTNFYITLGTRTATSPTGPDAFGYYGYDNTETQPQGCASQYQWVEIAPSQGGSGTSMGFSDTGENLDSSRTINLPFSFRFYEGTFTQITICSNGWLAFGSYAIDDYRNYRMGSPIGPPYMAAAYWDDLYCSGTANNCYYWYDAVSHQFIVEWRARTLHTAVSEYFEVMIYDPAYFPASDGSGKLKFQYNTVSLDANSGGDNDNLYATVGIEDGDHSTGVDYYYAGAYGAGSASLIAGRAIMFTTDASGALQTTITVTQPNGGESWFVGQPYNIQWQSTGVPGTIDIFLNRIYPAGSWETLFTGTADDGGQSWTVTAPVSAAQARIRVQTHDAPVVGDTSNAGFTIVMPSINLIAPVGGEFWQTGSIAHVEWTSSGLGPAQVELNRSYPSPTWELLCPSAGTVFDWQVAGSPTTTARIRVTGISVPTVSDTCNGNLTIGIAPVISHQQQADRPTGPVTFVARVTDDAPGFVTKVYYRVVGMMNYDSATFSATGYPDEYAATTPALASGRYEYYLRVTDPQSLFTVFPATGTYVFDVGVISANWTIYDDGTAENYNWVDGPGFQWDVKFDPGTYPYVLCAGRVAICATHPYTMHGPTIFQVLMADGPGGMPGTVVFSDTTGSAGNIIGGFPSGAAWAYVITRSGGQPLQLAGPFYLSVMNTPPRAYPVAFATDTLGVRNHRSYVYDNCDSLWLSEDTPAENTRPGNRMIRANGFPLTAPSVVVYRTDSAGVASATLRWVSTGAPYYRIFSSSVPTGTFTTLEGTVTGPAAGNAVFFTDVGAFGEAVKRFYQVIATDTP